MKKELIVPVFVKAKEVYCGWTEKKIDGDAVQLAKHCSNQGADAILVFDLSEGDAEHDASIAAIKEIAVSVDIPVYGGGNIKRMEDVKKLLYAGCRKVFLNYGKEENAALTKEVSERFGKEKILACVYREEDLQKADRERGYLGGIVITEQLFLQPETLEKLQELNCYVLRGPDTELQDEQIMEKEQTAGIASLSYIDPEFDFMERKHELLEQGILVNTYTCEITWDELKCGRDGLLPVVVQDYKTQEVLMMAYMNQKAYETTIHTGRMTYWSRSREELWVKGMTSGHIQYVKELRMDCDQDTLLAKVLQIGAACHTGNKSCFYRTILKKEYDETNPLKVFEDVFAVIQDRKIHPKEGSYTNYLFEKGIDKILKKVGEEATEIVIAAKNPDSEELKYEISDFLYHMMVLMAERGVSWEDITKELARR